MRLNDCDCGCIAQVTYIVSDHNKYMVTLSCAYPVDALKMLKCAGLQSLTQQFQVCTFHEPFQQLHLKLSGLIGLFGPACQ
jgi:hypothetical protein